MIRISTVFTFLILLSAKTYSTEHLKNADADQRINGAKEIWYKSGSSTPSYIEFRNDFNLSVENVSDWMKDEFDLPEGLNFIQLKSFVSNDKLTHDVFGVAYNDIPVEFARLNIKSENGSVHSISGNILKEFRVRNTAVIDKSVAIDNAINSVGAALYKWEMPAEEKFLQETTGDNAATFYPNPVLVIISQRADFKNPEFKYAYKMNIYAHTPNSSYDVYIDAEFGNVLFKQNMINEADSTGIAETAYSNLRQIKTDHSGQFFYLREFGRGNGIHTRNLQNGTNFSNSVELTDEDNNWTFLSGDLDQFATDAHWGAETTYDYLKSAYGINSINDSGFSLNSYVHYGESYNNARWDKTLKIIMYGDGPSNLIPLTALDVVAHEIGHGLTQFTANLIYENESGALNESFSDILGNSVEFFSKPGTASWQIGEDMGDYIRDMAFPNAKDQPDTYNGKFWYTGPFDNGGVHINSGVQNFWFYLLAQGGNGINDFGNSYDVRGIGILNASLITYKTLSEYLTPTSDYEEASFFSTKAAVDIFGNCSFQHEATAKAWDAVGLENNYIDHTVASFDANSVSFCNLPITVQFKNTSSNGNTFEWDFGDLTKTSVENPLHIYSAPGQYSVRLKVDGEGCGNDEVLKLNLINALETNEPIIESADIYLGDSILLSATSNTGDVYWFSDKEESNFLMKGNSFQTPSLDNTTSYYVKTVVEPQLYNVGPILNDNIKAGEYSSLYVGLKFQAYKDAVIHSFEVKTQTSGDRTFTIKNDLGAVVFEKTVFVESGIQKIILDAEVSSGLFEISCTGTLKNLWMAEGMSYPYQTIGLLTITGNNLDIDKLYPFFFNWEVREVNCESALKEVTVSVEDIHNVQKAPYKFYVNNQQDYNYFVDFFFKENTKVSFGLYGINGQLAFEFNKEYMKGSTTENINTLLNLTSYSPGVYFITVSGGNVEKTEKIINKGGSN